MSLTKIIANSEIAMSADEERAMRSMWASSDPKGLRHGLLAQIKILEGQQTPRRMRDFALGIDGGWLAALEAQIAALRTQL